MKFPNKKYNIIYADPPWQFKYQSKKRTDGTSDDLNIRDPQKEYPCMTIDDIYNMPVNEIADDNSILFLWVTYPLLKEGIKTMEEWGFTYKTCGFSWIKKNKKSDSLFWGLGYWTRANNEICLLGTKGKPKRVSKGVHQVVMSKIQKHSQKPDIVKDRIVELCGDVPRIELFARQRTKGWDVWGNEVPEEVTDKETIERFF
jgi:N6-adenosine-specific RNA methylase IME4|tara:strand:+ start:37 stop:639 length:603 start_codon:yes stop_codon:yes gene_type:complete